MQNEKIVHEWIDFSQMDLLTAQHLLKTMYPKPLEIICYHCQQSAEKMIKALLLAQGETVPRIHDLGLLIEVLVESLDPPADILDACDNLTPYGVKARYPQEMFLEEKHAQKALEDAEKISTWCRKYLT
jgi:HEPN domain-containing protein